MDRAGVECVAVVGFPMSTPVHALGLITFYLPQEAPASNKETIAHMERVVLELTMALEVISDTHASDALKQSLRSAFRGRVAEDATYSLDGPLGGIDLDALLFFVPRSDFGQEQQTRYRGNGAEQEEERPAQV